MTIQKLIYGLALATGAAATGFIIYCYVVPVAPVADTTTMATSGIENSKANAAPQLSSAVDPAYAELKSRLDKIRSKQQ